MTKPRIILAALAAGTFVLAACSAESTDYKAAAEKAITGKDGLGDGSSATCEKPASTDVGTTFTCTATDKDGTAYNFIATIDKKSHVLVSGDPGTGTADTTDGSTADTSDAGTEDTTETTVG
jgi:hypothetical protein